ncbi:MAG: hypothetical protein ACOY3X_07870 [Pseudomonadota bacterium]
MKHQRLSLLAVAIAAVALTGCEDDDNRPGSVSITTAGAPFVATDGLFLLEELGDVPSPGDLMMGPAGFAPGAVLSRTRAAAAAVVEGEEIACTYGGTYVASSNEGSWGVDYNSCVEGYVDGEYEEYTVLNGTATGTYGSYGGFTAEYEDFSWKYTESYEGHVYERESYRIDGAYEDYAYYGGYGGYTQYHNYNGDGLKISYSYKYDNDERAKKGPPPDSEISYSITYDEYDVTAYYYGGYQYWNGSIKATDSERGVWSIDTPDGAFGVDYGCDRVTGVIRFTGRVAEGEETDSFLTNILYVSGNGGPYATYNLYESDDETLISSYTYNWFEYTEDDYSGCSG